MDYDMEQGELSTHLDSLCAMTEAGKITWTLLAYDHPHFFVKNPFVYDMKTDIAHSFVVEGRGQGRTFVYFIWESISLPSGMCDIEVKEKTPDTEYEAHLSFERGYEYLTSQKQVLEQYADHPLVRFADLVMEQIQSADFSEAVQVDKRDRAFSFEPIPDEYSRLPILQRAQKLYERYDAAGFHRLVLSSRLRGGLGIKDL